VALIVGMVVVGLVVAIAAVVVVREAGRLAQEPPPPLFDADEAFDWVVEHVSDEVAATLTPDDVRRILDLQLKYFKHKGVATNGSSSTPPGSVVIGGAETVDYILKEAKAEGETYLPEQVHAVIDTQLSYLRAIGAIGPPAQPDPGESAT
jgi:hypothetical protein